MKARSTVRIECRSHAEVNELATRLEEDGHRLVRLPGELIARAETPEEILRPARCVSEPRPASPYAGWA